MAVGFSADVLDVSCDAGVGVFALAGVLLASEPHLAAHSANKVTMANNLVNNNEFLMLDNIIVL